MTETALLGTACGLGALLLFVPLPFLAFSFGYIVPAAFLLNVPAAAALRRFGQIGQPPWKTFVATAVAGALVGLGTRAAVELWMVPEYSFVTSELAIFCGVVDAAGMALWLRLDC